MESCGFIRGAAVAGTFYPADARILERNLRDMLDRVEGHHLKKARAIIAPHAGYVFSGQVAAQVYRQIEGQRYDRVVILGPAHRVAFHGVAVSCARAFETPLGSVRLDRAACEKVLNMPFVIELDDAHREEHSLETQLPFLQMVLHDHFEIVPLVVGECGASAVADLLEMFIDEEQTLIVISTDLSHFHDYQTALEIDRKTSRQIELLDKKNIQGSQACGCYPLNGLLELARRHHLEVERLGLCNSGDVSGQRDRVVGYGSYWLG